MKIACILARGFEDSELRIPADRLRDAGHEVVIIAENAGETLQGKQGQETVTADKSIDEVQPRDFDALFIPGGYSPDRLRADERFVDFVRRFDETGRLIAAVCHGPQILMTAERVRGRTMTAWKTVQPDLEKAGAHVVDDEVVVEGNLITSRNPDDLDAFSREVLKRLQDAAAQGVQASP